MSETIEEEKKTERSQREIVERIEMLKDHPRDFFGFESSTLITFLDFEHGKKFLKPEFLERDDAEEEWNKDLEENTRKHILDNMREYMVFAWDKANNERGISAGRSLSRFMAWTWLLGDDFGDLTSYEFYGKDHLVAICERYGFKNEDDGRRVNS